LLPTKSPFDACSISNGQIDTNHGQSM